MNAGSCAPRRHSILLAVLIAAAVIAILAFAAFVAKKVLSHRQVYKRAYETEINAAAEKYGLDPNLVFAVVRTESSFDPHAVSSAGAQGLMQLMDVAAEWVAMRTGTEFEKERVFEPEYNLDLGCYLLSYLMERYNGDIRFAAAAYNAGSGAVDRWLADPEYYDGETLKIPYGETKNYVEKVLNAYEKYTEQAKDGK